MEIAFRQKISASSQITDLMVNLHGDFLAAKMLIKIRFVVQLILSMTGKQTAAILARPILKQAI